MDGEYPSRPTIAYMDDEHRAGRSGDGFLGHRRRLMTDVLKEMRTMGKTWMMEWLECWIVSILKFQPVRSVSAARRTVRLRKTVKLMGVIVINSESSTEHVQHPHFPAFPTTMVEKT